MTLRRLPDEDPQNLADPAYRRRRIILQNMRDEELAIAQVEEMQAVSAVLKGKYTMTGEAFDPVEVDMGRSVANNITQSGGTEWSKRDKSTYDPTDDIEAYALNASGVVNIIVFDPKGWALFRSFKAVREKLDTRRGSNSELETAVKDLGEAVSYKGCMAIRRSSCIPDSMWKTTSKRTSFRTTRWCWGTLRHAVCAPMAAFRMRTHSAKVLTPLPATRKTG
ncbi:major head protein [Escherichia coli]|nr:major head protein [Escherichia coli]